MGGPLLALWGTLLLALLASAILLSLVQPWGARVPRRLPASAAWLGFAIMAPVGLIAAKQPWPSSSAPSDFTRTGPRGMLRIGTWLLVAVFALAGANNLIEPDAAYARGWHIHFFGPLLLTLAALCAIASRHKPYR